MRLGDFMTASARILLTTLLLLSFKTWGSCSELCDSADQAFLTGFANFTEAYSSAQKDLIDFYNQKEREYPYLEEDYRSSLSDIQEADQATFGRQEKIAAASEVADTKRVKWQAYKKLLSDTSKLLNEKYPTMKIDEAALKKLVVGKSIGIIFSKEQRPVEKLQTKFTYTKGERIPTTINERVIPFGTLASADFPIYANEQDFHLGSKMKDLLDGLEKLVLPSSELEKQVNGLHDFYKKHYPNKVNYNARLLAAKNKQLVACMNEIMAQPHDNFSPKEVNDLRRKNPPTASDSIPAPPASDSRATLQK